MVKLYHLQITLKHIKPAISRDFVVPGDINLYILHHVIQDIMGWEDAHLHEFVDSDGVNYQLKDDDFCDFDDFEPEEDYALCDIVSPERAKFEYMYDFGDGWEHIIKVKSFDYKGDAPQPIYCLKGKGACPPEDCGGIPGFMYLLEAVKNPDKEEYAEILQWYSDVYDDEKPFDPEYFSIEEVNSKLAELWTILTKAAKKKKKLKGN